MIVNQNSAVMFLLHIARLLTPDDDGVVNATIDMDYPRLIKLNSSASGDFLLARDENNDAVLCVPNSMLPWFVQVNWCRVAVWPEEGLLILEAAMPDSDSTGLAYGIKCRPARLDIILTEREAQMQDNGESRVMHILAMDSSKEGDPMFADAYAYTNVPLRMVHSMDEFVSTLSMEDAHEMFSRSGLGSVHYRAPRLGG